ncbi:hypothetical protein B0H11DRAFT_1907603 [Mycena galericulata]|nr:hypothetical protein B0H11DRAFT_1907603 [Mycena galericulata]
MLSAKMFAREHIKKAHNGRETRGVMIESTTRTIGASKKSITTHFVCSFLLLFAPLFVSLLAVSVSAIWLSLPWVSVLALAWEIIRAPNILGLVLSAYTYWTSVCLYFLYLARPHAFNVVKYQTFDTPWRYRRDHVSHMRLDRLRRACRSGPSSNRSSQKNIREALCHRGYAMCSSQGPMYLFGLWRPLRSSETMSELGVRGPRHFVMPARLLGGAKGSQPMLNERGWEQGALNPDGSHKDASEIDFTEPGVETELVDPGPSRPKRDKNQRMQAAAIIADQQDSDEGEPARGKKRKVKRRTTGSKDKGKQTSEALTDPEDETYSGDSGSGSDESDTDPEVVVTYEEIAESLPTKTVPEGSSRRKTDQPKKKKRKSNPTKNSDAPNPRAHSNATEPEVIATELTSPGTPEKPYLPLLRGRNQDESRPSRHRWRQVLSLPSR